MSDLKLELSIREEDGILFKRCIRKLLDATFIVKDKEERLYAYISRESNRQDISDYLRMIGFDVFVDDHVGVAMLRQFDDPVQLLKNVTSPNGTTQASLESLDADDFEGVISRCMDACTRRARELSEQY